MSFLDPQELRQFDDTLKKHLRSLSSSDHKWHQLTGQSLRQGKGLSGMPSLNW